MTNQEIANKIVEDLFSDGFGNKGKRLVMETDEPIKGAGWGKEAVRGRIMDILESADVLNAKSVFKGRD